MSERRSHRGNLAGGAPYRLEVPPNWSGRLILCSHGPLVPAEDPYFPDSPLMSAFLAQGYAIAGWATTKFWHLEDAFRLQPLVLDAVERTIGRPERTIAYGQSIGGLITAGLTQVAPGRLGGALAVCGPLAGGVATENRQLDQQFVVKTLLAPGRDLDLVRIRDRAKNLGAAHGILAEAKQTAQGRARLALAAALTNVPGWADATTPRPQGAAGRVAAQIAWFERIVFLVIFAARATVEERAGGNPSWNTSVDYRARLDRSLSRDDVSAMYAEARLHLEADLGTLDRAPRIDADPDAVEYMERHIAFDGYLRVPVVTMHTTGDGLCTPDHEQSFADVVRSAGRGDMLRQLWIERGGHCSFSIAETLVALNVLNARLDDDRWPNLAPDALRRAAAALGPDLNVGATFGPEHSVGAFTYGRPAEMPAAFVDFEPSLFPRPHDIRHVRARMGS